MRSPKTSNKSRTGKVAGKGKTSKAKAARADRAAAEEASPRAKSTGNKKPVAGKRETKRPTAQKPVSKNPAIKKPAARNAGHTAPTARRRALRLAAARPSRTAASSPMVAAFPGGWTWDPRYPGDNVIANGAVNDEFDAYIGLYDGTLRTYPAGSDAPAAISYSTKFTVDGDGSGGKQPGDDEYDPDTSLHYNDGYPASEDNALNALTYSFAVIPLPTEDFPNFTKLGIGLGDLGVAFFGRGKAAAFIYGDFGPHRKVGEGSVKMAKLLGMDWGGR